MRPVKSTPPRAAAPPASYRLRSWTVGALPLINHVLAQLDLDALLDAHLPHDARHRVTPAAALGVLLRNLLLGRQPVYGLGAWAAGWDPQQVGLPTDVLAALNDDRVGRALDHLFDADRATFLNAVVVRAVQRFDIALTQLHNDSTSVTFTGAYATATGTRRRGRATLAVTHGHNKDHRPDLKQLVALLTVSADGAIPLLFRVADGNTTDDTTHRATWEALCRLVGHADFLYVADAKLCVRETLRHIASHGGRFLTVLPRTRREDAAFREWIQTHEPAWVEVILSARARRRTDPPEVWKVCESPLPAADGYRLLWVYSSRKAEQDQQTRERRLERGVAALEDLQRRLQGPRARFRDRATVARAAEQAVEQAQAARWLEVTVEETVEAAYRQAQRGRPGPATRYRRIDRPRFTLRWQVRTEALAYDARCDGIFPLLTNWWEPSAGELLQQYKYQPYLEKRFEQLKTVYAVAPVWLKSVTRIEGLLTVFFLALLVEALMERELRRAMQTAALPSLPLYPEARACRAPTADRVFELFATVQRHELWDGDRFVQAFPPELTDLQRHVLALLDVPADAYGQS